MATTTNFGWSTPDNTAYVKDGASAIRTLGSSIDTTLGAFFNIKQIVTASTTTTATSTSSTDADTGLTATITPTATANKIIVLVSHGTISKSGASTEASMVTKLKRGATTLQTHSNLMYSGSAVLQNASGDVFIAFDAPSTLSATTYKTTFNNEYALGTVRVQTASSNSTIILIEVEA
jgi:hypothetical protein